MKNKILFKQYKQENDYLAKFLDIFNFDVNKIVSPDATERSQKAPDFLINNKIFVEIKELRDGADTKKSAQWGRIVNKLQKIISTKFKERNLKGLYGVETPEIFKLVGDQKFDQTVNDILNAIKEDKKIISTCGVTYNIEKVNYKYNEIYLSSMSHGGFINPADTVFRNISQKLKTANKQLSYKYKKCKISKKYLLIVNKYLFADRIDEVVEGLSYSYKELLKYKNIDEIWFQQEMQDGSFKHALIYNRDFITKFDKNHIDPDNKIHQEQFELWYWSLDKMGNKQNKLFDALEKFLDKYKPEDIFPDKFKRETMVRLGLWLIEHNKIKKAIWLIEQFINDPDPGDPKKYIGKKEFNYDKRLESGEDPTIITTVIGHLAWVVQKLARKSNEKNPENLIKAFEFTNKVLQNTKNLYIIQQWMIPLIEIANGRWFLFDKNPKLYKSFRSLILDKNNGLVKKHGNVPGIAKYMAYIFSYFKDLTTDETKLVLDKITVVDGSIPVLIYFAIYRPSHYKNNSETGKRAAQINKKILNYSPRYAINLLEKIINSKSKKYTNHRNSIVWNIWRILKEDPKQYKILKLWVDKLFYSPSILLSDSQLQILLSNETKKHPKDCLVWLNKLLDSYDKNLKVKDFGYVHHYLHMPEIIKWLEKNKENKESKIIIDKMEKLKRRGMPIS